MIRYIVDRLEEGLAVCETEDKKKAVFPLKDLPEAIREGDVLQELDGVFSRDEEETAILCPLRGSFLLRVRCIYIKDRYRFLISSKVGSLGLPGRQASSIAD